MTESRDRMTQEQKRLWDVVQIAPAKWKQFPWGDVGDGFWVVGVIGNRVLWYNDIEEGFNRSTFSKFGEIVEYWCNQDELGWTIQYFIDEIRDGHSSGRFASPPNPIEETDQM